MPKVINGAEEVSKDSFMGNMICRMIGDDFDTMVPDPKNISLAVIMNGKEVDVDKFFKDLNESIEHYAETKAAAMILDRGLGDLHSTVIRLSHDIEHFIKSEVAKAFPGLNVYDR